MTATTPSSPRTRRRPAAAAAEPRSPARVWWRAYRHHLRLVRNAAIAWITALTAISAGVVATFDDRYATEAERQALTAMEGIPAFEALVGRYVQVATVEGLTLSRWGMFGILVAVWAMLSAVKLLRGAEEVGHVEALRAGLLTPWGLLASVLAALGTVYVLFAVAIGATHSALGMDAATSWALGGAVALLAATFAAAGALASQVAGARRQAVGIVGAFLGLTLGVRLMAAATGTPEWLWWATPFGWIGYLHEVDEARGAVFGSFAVLVIALVVAALMLTRRELHAGLVGDGAEIATRPRPVRSQGGLAARLTAASAATWGIVLAVVGLAFGLLARDFSEAVADMPTMVQFAAEIGWIGIDTPEGVVAFVFVLVTLLLAALAAALVVGMREEEATWRIEHLLVRPVGRLRWLTSRVGLAAVALALLAAMTGVVAWLGTVIVGTPISFTDGLRAGLNAVPLAWLFLGLGVAVLGLAPRLTAPLTYGIVVAAFLLDFVGGFVDLPEAIIDLSPFRQLAAVPAADVDLGAALAMLAVGLAGAVIGVLAFCRRDLKEA